MILLNQLINAILAIVDKLGYFGIFVGMAVESSFIPFPSEVLLIPAGALVALAKMKFLPIIVLAILGSLFGAEINYVLGYYLGRRGVNKLVKKYGKIFLINKEKLNNADNYFKENGKVTIFIGRLIPGIRQIISIPAGFAKMDQKEFLTYTALGSGIWSLILIYLGYFFGGNMAVIKQNENIIILIVLLITFILILIYMYKKLIKNEFRIKYLNRRRIKKKVNQ